MKALRLLEDSPDFFACHAMIDDEIEADLGEGEMKLARHPLERPRLAGEVGTKIDDGNGFGGSQCDSGSADQGDDRGQTMYGLASARFRWPLISRRRPDGSLGQGLVEL